MGALNVGLISVHSVTPASFGTKPLCIGTLTRFEFIRGVVTGRSASAKTANKWSDDGMEAGPERELVFMLLNLNSLFGDF